MDRRLFLSALAGAAALPLTSQAAGMAYARGLVAKHLEAGDTVFLDFKASWCTTCAAQERVLDKLKAANPDYEANIVFIDVDWDMYRGSDLVKTLKIPRRSTLVALRGDQEIGRIVAQTAESKIKALMDDALNAAVG